MQSFWEQPFPLISHINSTSVRKKAHQRLYFLRQLKKFRMRREILYQFYKASIESILTFSICVWFGGLTREEKASLNRVIKISGRIIGSELPSIEKLFEERSLSKSKKIIQDQTHPARRLFQVMPSGRRYRSLKAKTDRFKNSFYLQAIRLLNKK